MTEDKKDKSAPDKDKKSKDTGGAANSEGKGKTFDMYHVKSRLDLVFLIGFVLVMVLLFVFAVLFAGGDGV